jgi:hypothetical protein
MKTNFLSVCHLGFLCALISGAASVYGSLEQAKVSRTLNEVFIHKNADAEGEFRPAQAGVDVVSGEQILRTGQRSRAELIFGDDSLARIGSNTVFTFQPQQREMFLGRGLLLYQASKGSGNTTRISTTTATASITGTTVLVEVGEKVSKIILLEGSMRVEIPGRPGEYVDLKAGQMLLFPNDTTRLPDPVEIDIAHLVQTSDLVQGFEQQEGEESGLGRKVDYTELEKAWEQQKKYLEENKLVETDLVIPGRGSTVVLNIDQQPILHLINTDPLSQAEGQDVIMIARDTREPEEDDDNSGTPNPDKPNPPAPPPPPPVVVMRPPLNSNPDPFVLGDNAIIQTNPHITVGDAVFPGAIYYPSFGPLTQFLFGQVSEVDQALGLSGIYSGPPTAWFRFSNLNITADPQEIQVIGGVKDMGLIADGTLTVASGYYTFAPLNGLLLTARDQVILGTGLTIENPELSLVIYNRSTSNPLLMGPEAAFILRELSLYSGGDITIDGVYTEITDKLDIRSLGEVTLASEQYLRASRIEILAQTLNLMHYSGFGPSDYCDYENSSLWIRTLGDMNLEINEGQEPSYMYFEMGDVVLNIGRNLNGQGWELHNIRQLTVGGNLLLEGLFNVPDVQVNGDMIVDYEIEVGDVVVGGDLSAGYYAYVDSLNVGGDVTAGDLYLFNDITVEGDLHVQKLYARMPHESNQGGLGLLSVPGPLPTSIISVGGEIIVEQGDREVPYALRWWDSTHALTLKAPDIVFADDQGIRGAWVTRLEYNGESYDQLGGSFSVYGDNSVVVKNSSINVIGQEGGGSLLLESPKGYVHLKENAILKAANQEYSTRGDITVRAKAPAPNGIAIQVSSSAQILALAQNSSILLDALAGDVEVAGVLHADNIEIVAHGDNARVMLLPEANISAEVFKAGAFGNNGVLRIGGSESMTLSAYQQLYLYANATNGTVRFVGDTTLLSNDVVIAAHRVEVDNGVSVQLPTMTESKAAIYANEHLYNSTGYGSINGIFSTDVPANAPPFFQKGGVLP